MNNDKTEPFKQEPEDFSDGVVARARKALEEAPEMIGPYRVIERLGAGGMGEVFRADQKAPIRRQVAIKLIKLGMDTKQVVARFEAERQALAMMDHPNIAKVFDGGTTADGRPYFVMEYVKGVPFTEYCDSVKLPLRERLNLFIPVCQAVQHAHQKGIVHRDLKPSNILICLYDGRPVPKVIDFGLAKALYQPLTDQTIYTKHGMMVGTPLYMSPEQAEQNNLDIDTRTDIYSLGVILYELLTGLTPLERDQLRTAAYNEVLRLIKEVEPPKPSTRLSGSASLPSVAAQRGIDPKQLSRSLAGDLDWIVMKALDKERSRRYDTAVGFAKDIERYLNDEAVEACPPSAGYRLKKVLNKHRGKVVAASMLLCALIIGIIGTSLGFYQAKIAETKANQSEAKTFAALEGVTKERDEKEKQRQIAEDAKQAEEHQRKIAEQQKTDLEHQAYRLGLQTAYNSLEAGELDSARETLETLPERLRGWEWRWLMAETEPWLGRVDIPQDSEIIGVTSNGNRALTQIESDSTELKEFRVINSYDGSVADSFAIPNVVKVLKVSLAKNASRISLLVEILATNGSLATSIYVRDKSQEKLELIASANLFSDGYVYTSPIFEISPNGNRLLISINDSLFGFDALNMANGQMLVSIDPSGGISKRKVKAEMRGTFSDDGLLWFGRTEVVNLEDRQKSFSIANQFDDKVSRGVMQIDDDTKAIYRYKDTISMFNSETRAIEWSCSVGPLANLAVAFNGRYFAGTKDSRLIFGLNEEGETVSVELGRAKFGKFCKVGIDVETKSIYVAVDTAIFRYGKPTERMTKRYGSIDWELNGFDMGPQICGSFYAEASEIRNIKTNKLENVYFKGRLANSYVTSVPYIWRDSASEFRLTDLTKQTVEYFDKPLHLRQSFYYDALVTKDMTKVAFIGWTYSNLKSGTETVVTVCDRERKEPVKNLLFHNADIFCCDQNRIWVAKDKQLCYLDLTNVNSALKSTGIQAEDFVVSPRRKQIIALNKKSICFHDIDTLEVLKSIPLITPYSSVLGILNEDRIICGGNERMSIIDLSSGAHLLSFRVSSYYFSPEDELLVIDGRVQSTTRFKDRWIELNEHDMEPKTKMDVVRVTKLFSEKLVQYGSVESAVSSVEEERSMSLQEKLYVFSSIKDAESVFSDRMKGVEDLDDLKARLDNNLREGEFTDLSAIVFAELVKEWKPSPFQLNSNAWAIVKNGKRTKEDYLAAMKVAVEASNLESNFDIMNTLGVAFYRVGEYQKCIDCLRSSINPRIQKQPSSSIIFTAMSFFKLGDVEKANSLIDEVIKQSEKTPFDEEDQGFLEEAKVLIGRVNEK